MNLRLSFFYSFGMCLQPMSDLTPHFQHGTRLAGSGNVSNFL